MKELIPPVSAAQSGADFPLSPKGILAVHRATLEVLARTGIRFASEQALEIFKKHAFRVEGQRVFFTEKDILKALETVPRRFTILARNPKYNVLVAPGVSSFGLGRSAVYMVEPDGSYRRGTSEDLLNATKLSQCLDVLEHWHPLVYPNDMEPANIQLSMCHMMAKYTDKPYLYISRHEIDLIALAYGTTREKMAERSDFDRSYGQATGIVLSPLSFTVENCENQIEYARCGIAFHIASMPVAGTTGPCTLAGLAVLQNCENLAPIVLSQLVRPGCPVFYGAIGGRTDMQSLRPRFGTAEARVVERAGVQMARLYGLACRGGAGLTDAPACDFQAGAQAMLNMISILLNGANLLPACGLLGSYLGASLAKVVLDAELITQARRFLAPIRTDPESLAVKVIDEVGPGGNYIEHSHTAEHYRREFLIDSLFQSLNYEQWSARGKKDAVHLAHEKALQLIASYRRPAMDPGLEAEIDDFVKHLWIHG